MKLHRVTWSVAWLSSVLSLVMLAAVGLLLRGVPEVQAATGEASGSNVHVLRSDQHGIVLELMAPEYTIEQVSTPSGTFQRPRVAGLDYLTEPGLPQLPKATALLGIPPEAQVSVRVLQDDAMPLTDRYRLLPARSPAPLTDELQPGQWQYVENVDALAGMAAYPTAPARVVDVAWLRDRHLARIEIYPFQYRPAESSLVWHRRLVIEVSFEEDKHSDRAWQTPQQVEASDPFDAVLSRIVLNDDIARAWRATPSTARLAATTLASTAWTDPRYRIVVDRDGLYRITYADLQAAGFITTTFDPRNFHLTNQGLDVAIEVDGEADGQFDLGDSILFYGQKLRGDRLAAQYASEGDNYLTYYNAGTWKPAFDAFMVERYTDENVYWLTVETTPGLRMSAVNGTPSGSAPQPDCYTATVRAEQSHRWRTYTMTGEDTFFWEFVNVSSPTNVSTSTFATTLTALSSSIYSAAVRGEVVATTGSSSINPDHHTRFVWNGATTPLEDSTWDGPIRHRFTGQVASTDLNEGTNNLNLELERMSGLNGDTLLFDWFEIDYRRRLQAEDDQLIFTGDQIGARQYNVSNLTDGSVYVYDVSNPLAPQHVLSSSIVSSGSIYTASFEATSTQPVTYLVASAVAIRSPKAVTKYLPAIDLTSPANRADYIMITSRMFYTTVQRLADYRAAQGLRVQVVDLDDVFNQFTYGIYHPIAIKAFLKYAYEQWQKPAPAYVLLVGDGHFNFKGYTITTKWGTVPPFTQIYMPPNLSWIDPWQGEVDSANLLAALVGSDFLPEMSIGRIPVRSADELNGVISKTIAYETAGPQPWQRRTTYIADNRPDAAGDFVALSEQAIQNYAPPNFAADRIYENDFGCSSSTSANCAAVRYAITNTLNQTGALLVNYVGHGSTYVWSGEQILADASVPTINNPDRLPIILSWTCLDGFWSHFDTQIESGLMESMLRSPTGGAVATFSPTGLGVATGHDVLQRGLYHAIFEDGVQRLGPATLAAKLELYNAGHDYDLLNTFTIFGDPALRLPTYALEVDPAMASQFGSPNKWITYTLQVTNVAFLTDTIGISVTGGSGPISVSHTSLVLPPGQSEQLWVSTALPLGTPLGAVDVITVAFLSHGDGTRPVARLATINGLYGATALASPSNQSAIPTGSVSYTIQITNVGLFTDSFALSLTGNTWPSQLSGLNLNDIPPNGTATFQVTVTVPAKTVANTSDMANVIVTSQGSQGFVNAAVALTTTARPVYGFDMSLMNSSHYGVSGQTVLYTLLVTNTGNLTNTFSSVVGQALWPTVVSPTLQSIAPWSSANTTLRVSIPLGVGKNATDTAIVTGTMQLGDVPPQVALITTTANPYQIMLPLVRK